VVDEHDRVRLGGYPGAFTDLLGVRIEEFCPLPENATVQLTDGSTGHTWTERGEADTNRALVAAAERLVVVADHTKWGTVGISSIAALRDAHVLVTDSGLTAPARGVLADAVGELIVAEAR